MKEVTIYADGACSNNGTWKGGWGCVLIYKGTYIKTVSGAESNTTNSRMEIQAVLEGLKRLKEPCKVTIYSDSIYVVNTINEWLDNWISADKLASKANVDQWEEYIKYKAIHKIKAKHVKGHSGDYFNEICDKLATNAIKGVIVDDKPRKVNRRLK